jgi:hypothetical protein
MLSRFSRFEVFDGGLGAAKICLGLRHPGPIIIILDLDRHLAFFDALKIINGDAAYVAQPQGGERRQAPPGSAQTASK